MRKPGFLPTIGLVLLMTGLACNTPFVPNRARTPTAIGPTTTPTLIPIVTESQPPTRTPSPACVPPADVPLPSESPPAGEYPVFLADYLSAGGSVEALRERLREWGLIDGEGAEQPYGLVRDDLDFTGGGIKDVLIVIRNPDVEPIQPYPVGDLFLFSCVQGAYVLQYSLSATEGEQTVPLILSTSDLTGDGVPDLLYDRPTCGAHTCFSNVQGVYWSTTSGSFVTLLPQPINEPYPEIDLVDRDGDGLSEIVVESGVIGSVGAGPQRTFRIVYDWDGTAFVPIDKTLTSNQHPIHLINDADDLLAAGDAAGALTLYEGSYSDLTLDRSWEMYEGWERDLESYARYKMLIAYVVLGDLAAAQTAYEHLLANYPGVDQPGGVFAAYARVFWESYAAGANLTAACDAVLASLPEDFIISTPLNRFGYANKFYQAADMCPFGSP